MTRWLGLALLTLLVLLLGVALGSVSIEPSELPGGLLRGTGESAVIVRELRLPRVLLAFLVGGSLAVSGAALQALVRNPLADPYLLGLSGGAGLGPLVHFPLG